MRSMAYVVPVSAGPMPGAFPPGVDSSHGRQERVVEELLNEGDQVSTAVGMPRLNVRKENPAP